MLKRKRSLIVGGLTSSCRIKAEALARAFNSRIWPCSWRSTQDRRQDDDEEFYETSPIEDDDWGGRGPDRSAATEEGRAKLYELLQQHAMDDATDVFYDVSEHAVGGPETESGKVSERLKKDGVLLHDVVLHEPGEKPNGIRANGEHASECSNSKNGCEMSNCVKADRDSSIEISNYDECQSSIDVNNEQFAIECLRHSGCQSSNGMKAYEKSSIECLKFEDCCETSNVNDPMCTVDEQTSSESSKFEDSCETSENPNRLELSPTECSKCDNRSPISNTTGYKRSLTESPEFEHGCETSVLEVEIACTEFVNLTSKLEYTSNKVDDSLINCNAAETTISNCSVECLSNQEYPSVEDSGKTIDFTNVTESINTASLLECLNSPASLDLSVNIDSNFYAKRESTDTELTSLTNSFECLHTNSENVLLNTTSHETCIQNCQTNDNFYSVGNTNEGNFSSSEVSIEDINSDFSVNFNSDNLSSCINNLDKPPNQLNKSETLSDSCIKQLNSLNSQTIKDHSASTTTDFLDEDSHFVEEEILTVIIDSNLFNIHQTENYNVELAHLCNDEHANLPNYIPAPPEFSSSNSDPEAIALLNVPNNLQLTEDINDVNSTALLNGCDKISVLNCQESVPDPMNNYDQEAMISSKELNYPDLSKETNEVYLHNEIASLENTSGSSSNNDKEEKIPLNATKYPVSIQVTNAGNSPTHDNCKTTGIDYLEDKSTDEDCRLKVFDESRPMISRSTSLKTGKTPPGTPSRKKIVRFADVLGLDLEDVRHIISGDLPNIPSSAYSDLALGSDPFPATVSQSVKVDLNCRQQASWESVPSLAGPNAIYPLFAIPGQQPDFMERVRSSGICLEGIVIEDCNIQCTCRVMNWGYNKKVVARYTTNSWSTSCDINASYVSDSTRDGTDSFAFNIFLSRDRSDMQFALRYEINGNEYWDNNCGKNYCFSYHSNNTTSQTADACSPTWMGLFW